MRDTDYAAAQLLALADRKHHEVTEYEGSIHVRYGRRVVFVYDVANDSYRVNEVTKAVEQKAINRCLAILAADRQLVDIQPGSTIRDTNGKEIKRAKTFVWRHLRTSPHAEPVISVFTPREEFSGITGVSLSTAAGRKAHQEALDA